MTMVNHNLNNMLALTGLCLIFAIFVNAKKDPSCPGPKKFYEDVGCTPVYKSPDSKCPEKYNCNILKELPKDKCFLNGHTYEIGEALSEDDANPCNIGCYCSKTTRGPQFFCASVSCYYWGQAGCYQKRNATSCCGGPEICPEEPADRSTCTVNGKIYRDGEYFRPEAEPEKECYCGEGYTGENVEPFCITRKTSTCEVWLNNLNDLRENCIPTYDADQSPETHCTTDYRCPYLEDSVVVHNDSDDAMAEPPADPEMQCHFGNLTMNVGDELNRSNEWRYSCMKCVCEVPPIPTCQRLPYNECFDQGPIGRPWYPRPAPYLIHGMGGIHGTKMPVPPPPPSTPMPIHV